MRILIDLQCAQRDHTNWGIGAHFMRLVEALLPLATRDGHEVHLLLDSAFTATLPELHRRFPGLYKLRRIHAFRGLCSDQATSSSARWRLDASNVLRDFTIASLSPNVLLQPSSFFKQETCPIAIGNRALSNVPSIALHHDLVPSRSVTQHVEKTTSFNEVIAVSENARCNAIDTLHIPEDRSHVISGDASAEFVPPDDMSLSDMEALRLRYMLMRPYLLAAAPHGISETLSDLVDTYTALPRGMVENLDLVIVGDPSEKDVQHAHNRLAARLLDLSHIRILPHVSNEDLPGLFGLAELFVTQGWEQGFGLPALQAIRSGTLAIGPDINGVSDTICTQETLFVPADVTSLRSLLMRGLTDTPFRTEMQDRQRRQTSRFSWKESARRIMSILSKYQREESPELDWPTLQRRMDTLEAKTIALLKNLPKPDDELSDCDRNDLARALAKTKLAALDTWRPRALPNEDLKWRLEGPFDSTYSLAAVNRETAHALEKRGIITSLLSSEGDGPFDPDPAFLKAHPKVAALHEAGQATMPEDVDILSRNMFPPRVHDMRAPWNMLHGYAWEETGLPQAFAQDMISHLQGILVTSPHVEKTFKDIGINVPIHVVGNGVDHLDVPPVELPFEVPNAALTYLHVSSCFPRKGPDILLKGFAEAFQDGEDVQLIIKTFPNPHNDIADQIAKLRNAYSDLPPITVVEQTLTLGQMRSLYAAADLLVMPSRAEGYCLPIAEALLAGTPVLTTGWSGQKIFSNMPLVSFIDYQYAPAKSHLGAWDSVWAEPDLTDLTNKLQAHYIAPKPTEEMCLAAAAKILSEHTWDNLAECSENAVRKMVAQEPSQPPRIGWISSYNTRCGIATYSAHLIKHIPDQVTVFASYSNDTIDTDGPSIKRCWHQDGQDTLTDLRSEIHRANLDVLVIQFNYGFYSFAQLGAFILGEKSAGRKVVMMLHATDDIAVHPERRLSNIRSALAACDLLLVHTYHDLNRLKSLGLEENVALFPHGVPYTPCPGAPAMSQDRSIMLGTYGFFLPPKGLSQLIEATAILRDQGENVGLNMVNAEFPIQDSANAIAEARRQISDLKLHDIINLETGFLDDDDSFARLASCDALVFAYQKTAESASGAIRQALALDRPVIATPLPIFDDVAPLILRLPGMTAPEIAKGVRPIVRALRNPETEPKIASKLREKGSMGRRWRESHAYQVLGPRLWRQILNL